MKLPPPPPPRIRTLEDLGELTTDSRDSTVEEDSWLYQVERPAGVADVGEIAETAAPQEGIEGTPKRDEETSGRGQSSSSNEPELAPRWNGLDAAESMVGTSEPAVRAGDESTVADAATAVRSEARERPPDLDASSRPDDDGPSESGDRDWIVDGFEHGDRDKIAGEVSIRDAQVRIHLRHMARLGAESDWFWTRRGIAFDPGILPEIVEAIEQAIQASDEIVTLRRPQGRDELRVGLNIYRGVRYVYVRRFYVKGEDWLPTKKGVSVRQDEGGFLLDLARRTLDKCAELGL